jgi:hypothetical protein
MKTDAIEAVLSRLKALEPEGGLVGPAVEELEALLAPIPMRLCCESCGEIHEDVGPFATKEHHTHACQNCGAVWRPSVRATVGVRFLPGFKNEPG